MITANTISELMTYRHSVMAETIETHGFKITIEQDMDCDNPYYSDEGMSPAIWFNDHGFIEPRDSELESVIYNMSPSFVSRHWRKIAAIVDMKESYVQRECKELQTDDPRFMGIIRQDYFAEHLAEMKPQGYRFWGQGIDYLNAIAELFKLQGIPAETFQRNGYGQGDSVYGLIVMTPDWANKTGCPYALSRDLAKCSEDMRAQADQFGAWAFGDCYYFTITDSEGEHEDSCGGFIGSDGMKSGIYEAIAESLNSAIRAKQLARQKRIKEMIKARTPLQYRVLA